MDDGRSGKSQGDEGARQMREGTERRGEKACMDRKKTKREEEDHGE